MPPLHRATVARDILRSTTANREQHVALLLPSAARQHLTLLPSLVGNCDETEIDLRNFATT
eukprot:1229494-Prymnesium_polylepis.4